MTGIVLRSVLALTGVLLWLRLGIVGVAVVVYVVSAVPQNAIILFA